MVRLRPKPANIITICTAHRQKFLDRERMDAEVCSLASLNSCSGLKSRKKLLIGLAATSGSAERASRKLTQ